MSLTTVVRGAATAVVSRGEGTSGCRPPERRPERTLRRLGLVLSSVFIAMATAVSTVSARSTSDLGATRDPGSATAPATAMSLPPRFADAAATARAAAAPAGGTVFGGLTSQGWPVVLDVPRGGKRIAVAGIGLRMTCSSGGQAGFPDSLTNVSIAPNGNVNVRMTIPPLPGTPITGGFDSLSGRFDRRRSTFSGSWQLHIDFKFPTGPDHCDSGRVGFRARQ